ncbi:MAG: adenylyltransferase/cytidyltransferase family protein [Phycisphaeraceae bacterium]|nr:adenylyltransferase/cytidyltransferase family protein [Phycisphaeraceae bacterium]
MPGQILSHAELLAARDRARSDGRRVVQCHGCFDIVHPGHIRHLRFARAQGDILLVSITADEEIGKGAGRPLIPQELRAENLAALDCVDWVYVEPRPTAAELLCEVRPDVFIKGREYEFNRDPRFEAEREAVERHGGRVVFSSGDVVFSSTALIAAMERTADPYHRQVLQLSREPDLAPAPLADLIASMRGRRIVVLGETILDTYVLCDQPGVAGESPIMTLRPIERRHYEGGSAIIARHAAALGARPTLVTALPSDDAARALTRRLLADGVEVRALPVQTPVPEKQRFLVGGQKVVKLDLVEPLVLDAGQQRALLGLLREALDEGCDAGIIADFGLGMISPLVAKRGCALLRSRTGFTAGDVSGRRSRLLGLRGLDLLTPSETELREALRNFDDSLPAATWKMLEQTRARSAIVSLGADGLIAFDRLAQDTDGWDRRVSGRHIPALAPIAVDALGCGDTLLTISTLVRASGGSLLQAAFLGSIGAAHQAQRLGNLPIGASELRQGVARLHAAHLALSTADAVGPARPRLDDEILLRAS